MGFLREFVPICLVCGVLGVGAVGMVRIGQDGRPAEIHSVSSTAMRGPAIETAAGAEPQRIILRSQDSGVAGNTELDALFDRIKKAEDVIRDPQASVDDMADAFVDRDSAFCMLRRAVVAPGGGASSVISAYLGQHAGEHPCDSVMNAPVVVFVSPPDRTVHQ
jgi:hypothetical protein